MTDAPPDPNRVDVLVIGGGPAGAACATFCAQKGHRVRLLEKSRFPRFHIGESLMPETYWPLKRMGLLERLKASRFPRKYSVQFVGASGRASRPFYFHELNDHESSVTWQVPRDEFDAMLLDAAAEQGAQVCTDVRVSEVLFEESRAVGVVTSRADGGSDTIMASVVVDATGQGTLLARRLDLKRVDPNLRKASIYAHYRGARRDAGIDEGATVILYTPKSKGWFWYIPLPDDRVSVGVVASPEQLYGSRRGNPQRVLDAEIAACPGMRERLAGAEQITDVQVARDFSYRAEKFAGDGWVMVGDAMGFVDPIYSSGVFLALKSGELAAERIDEGLRSGDLTGAQLGAFAPTVIKGMEAIRKLVYAFYDEGFNFGEFLRAHPDQRDNLVSLLIGDVFRDEVYEIFKPMGRMCKLPESSAGPIRDAVRRD